MLILEIIEEIVVSLLLMFFAASLSLTLFKIKNHIFRGTSAQQEESYNPVLNNVYCYDLTI